MLVADFCNKTVQPSSPSSPASSLAALPRTPVAAPRIRDALAFQLDNSPVNTRKRERTTGRTLLSHLSGSVDRLADIMSASSDFMGMNTLACRSMAYQRVLKRDPSMSKEGKRAVMRLFQDKELTDEYLTFGDDEETCQAWLEAELV